MPKPSENDETMCNTIYDF